MEDGHLPTANKCEVEIFHFLTLWITVLPSMFGFEVKHLPNQMHFILQRPDGKGIYLRG